ncbi:MAG: YpdA family putative bacillithiol disulfide reductase [Acidobacteriota bacterium]
MTEKLDLIIVGAGAAGLACAIEAQKRHLAFQVIEKGSIVNSIYHFPVNMTFFTSGRLLEIGDIPLVTPADKPKRLEGLKYYRRVAEHYQLPIKDYERVLAVTGQDEDFRVQTLDRFDVEQGYHCRKIIIATGYYDNPNRLRIPGEDLDKVSHYYAEPHPYFRKKVAVIGGKNSAVEAALELYRNGAEVTLIHRRAAIGDDVKYWLLPDINNRIRRGEITTFLSSHVEEIKEREIAVATPRGTQLLENDFVLALIGYHPDVPFLSQMGIELEPDTLIPSHNPETLETNVKGIYVAGAIVSGRMTNRIFIENGRFHGIQIFRHWPLHHGADSVGCGRTP